jgi:hypothetical protein
MRCGDFLEYTAASRAWARKVTMTKRAIGDDGNIVLYTPREHSVFNRALLQMIEDLIANERICDAPSFCQIDLIEVTDAPGKNLPLILKLLKRSDRVFKRLCATPVQKIAIESVGVQPDQ